MPTFMTPSPFLRLALVGDAIASGGTGLLLSGGAGYLTSVLGLPVPLMHYTGLFLLAYAAFVGYVGMRAAMSKGVIWAIIIANSIWAVESLLALLGGWLSPTPLGTAFVIAQALVVAGFAQAQWIGLRKSNTTTLADA
ncbi:MAG: hypothetical protein O9308_14545 [Beijerinckiaceae bacterium]|nr:hypothetical protein [Beijerinckiaceae bacterium]